MKKITSHRNSESTKSAKSEVSELENKLIKAANSLIKKFHRQSKKKIFNDHFNTYTSTNASVNIDITIKALQTVLNTDFSNHIFPGDSEQALESQNRHRFVQDLLSENIISKHDSLRFLKALIELKFWRNKMVGYPGNPRATINDLSFSPINACYPQLLASSQDCFTKMFCDLFLKYLDSIFKEIKFYELFNLNSKIHTETVDLMETLHLERNNVIKVSDDRYISILDSINTDIGSLEFLIKKINSNYINIGSNEYEELTSVTAKLEDFKKWQACQIVLSHYNKTRQQSLVTPSGNCCTIV